MKEIRGPRIEYWGTPALKLAQNEQCSLCTTLYFLFLRKLVKRLKKFPNSSFCSNLRIIP